ncbi:MAG: aspartate carbamoyltransferase regulatory subunit [Candidatus Thermoplasmatota archaeon]|nr:aspartate carbamoyltransferase regulatory subunit [Candidatus Thermoplasmatota archaeon]
MSSGEMRRVTAINNGTVIDHIPAGTALSVLQMLGISDDRASPISLVMNVPSSKHGRKDIIKVEDRELTQDELDRLALIAPKASVAIIRSYTVAEKREVAIGTELVNVASCTFSNCITTNPREPQDHRLNVVNKDPLELRCRYCGRPQDMGELISHLI